MTIKIQGDKITFPDDSEQTTAYDGSSGGVPEAPIDGKQYGRQDANWTEVTGGGGSTPTPEALVWEDVSADRTFDTVYTNTNDVPIYVQAYFSGTGVGANNVKCSMDGAEIGFIGNNSSTGGSVYLQMPMFIVPAGSTYEFEMNGGTSVVDNWREARMPLAIGVPSVDTVIGMVAPFAMDSVPTGWLHCDGSAVSRTTYSLLYSKVADLYGAGDGSTTFNLPNLQDEFIRGSSDTLPVGNKQNDEFKAHNHNYEKFPGPAGNAIGYGNGAVQQSMQTTSTGGEETRPRNVAMLYCINATAEPSSGGGGTTDILPVLMSGRVNEDGTKQAGLGFETTFDGTYYINFDTPLDEGYVVSVSATNYLVANVFNETSTQCRVNFYNLDGEYVPTEWQFSIISLEPIKVGGGGSSYTPEPMVWEDKLTERAEGIEYTNDTGRLLNVSVISKGGVGFSSQLLVNDKPIAFFTYNTANHSNTVNVIVPVGATYKFNSAGDTSDITGWNEAEMPLAVATGGKTVAFKGELSDDQTGIASTTWTKVNLDTSDFDTDSALTDGKFQPSVAGYYQINGAVTNSATSGVNSSRTVAGIYKNGNWFSKGDDVGSAYGVGSKTSSVSDVVYLNGTTDYLELYAYLEVASGTARVESSPISTFLSAVLVSGGSASGDSIWTEVDGEAVYDGDIEVNGITVGRGSGAVATNTSVGVNSLNSNTNGAGNTALGYDAGTALTSGSNCTIIGRGAQASSPIINNEVTIGNDDVTLTRLRGKLLMTGNSIWQTTANVPNMYVHSSGEVMKSSATFYSAEEVDGKLAIKDTLIEKLSARLDELEKKVK